MFALPYFFVFVFGTVIGSFLNVVILRHNTGESIVAGGSRCLACAKKLKWYELIPIASFVFLRGKCAACKSKVSWQYPLVETITGIIFVLLFQQSQSPNLKTFWILDFGFWILVFSLLIIIAVYDYYHQIIPDKFVYSFIGLSFLGLFFGLLDLGFIWNLEFGIWNFMSGIILFAFFALMWLVSHGRWMGFGDAKLALGIGWTLGLAKGATAVVLAFWLGAIVGVFLLFAAKKKYGIKSKIAFGPFLVLGTIIVFFTGEALVKIFFHNFLF